MSDTQTYDHAAALLAKADHTLALTGAGISAESGIPTFREAQTSLWARFSPQDLATPEAFNNDPERVWAWYRWRRTLIARGGVNPGHTALAELGRRQRVSLATQNVDGLHAAAGSDDVAELHGNIWRERCTVCNWQHTVSVAAAAADAPLPVCPECGHLLRPDVVWFGEALPGHALNAASSALESADCVLVIGTSNQVYPAAALVETAIAADTPVIEINPQTTAVSGAVTLRLAESASVALPALLARLDSAPGTH
jgi:NAD-dependent deacetylase